MARSVLNKRLLKPRPIAGLRRIGSPHDGGYVIPDGLISRTRVLLSLGISDDWSFESAFQKVQPSVRVVGVDGSVGYGHFFIKGLCSWFKVLFYLSILNADRLRKHAARLAVSRDFFRFFKGNNSFLKKWVGRDCGERSISLTRLLEEHGAEGSPPGLFLKIDIEGSEYEVLDQLLPLSDRVLGVVVEFHRLGSRIDQFNSLLERVCGKFTVVHAHGNNYAPYLEEHAFPDTVEATFVNASLMTELAPGPERPGPIYGLDAPNDPARADHPLKFD